MCVNVCTFVCNYYKALALTKRQFVHAKPFFSVQFNDATHTHTHVASSLPFCYYFYYLQLIFMTDVAVAVGFDVAATC